jgi:hypothetical protein
MGVHDDRDARRAQVPQVVQDLASLLGAGTGVDHERGVPTQHGDDVLVEESVAPDEYAVADLGP